MNFSKNDSKKMTHQAIKSIPQNYCKPISILIIMIIIKLIKELMNNSGDSLIKLASLLLK